jgi:hypothetical protein
MRETFFALALVLMTACSLGSQAIVTPAQVTESFNYDKYLSDRYKEVETKPSVVETWQVGLLTEYGLVFDHLVFVFTKSAEAVSTDGKHLISGKLLAIAYAKTRDGEKKRLIQEKDVCHIFLNQTLEKTLTIEQKDHVVKQGWDEGVSI